MNLAIRSDGESFETTSRYGLFLICSAVMVFPLFPKNDNLPLSDVEGLLSDDDESPDGTDEKVIGRESSLKNDLARFKFSLSCLSGSRKSSKGLDLPSFRFGGSSPPIFADSRDRLG